MIVIQLYLSSPTSRVFCDHLIHMIFLIPVETYLKNIHLCVFPKLNNHWSYSNLIQQQVPIVSFRKRPRDEKTSETSVNSHTVTLHTQKRVKQNKNTCVSIHCHTTKQSHNIPGIYSLIDQPDPFHDPYSLIDHPGPAYDPDPKTHSRRYRTPHLLIEYWISTTFIHYPTIHRRPNVNTPWRYTCQHVSNKDGVKATAVVLDTIWPKQYQRQTSVQKNLENVGQWWRISSRTKNSFLCSREDLVWTIILPQK